MARIDNLRRAKTGGRKPGGKNKATIERERAAAKIAELTVLDARATGKKLAKEVLEDFMFVFAGMSAHYQPAPPGAPVNRGADEDRFRQYAELSIDCAGKLAKYQSPTFQATTWMPPMSAQPQQPAPAANSNVTSIDDPAALGRIYRKMITAVRG